MPSWKMVLNKPALRTNLKEITFLDINKYLCYWLIYSYQLLYVCWLYLLLPSPMMLITMAINISCRQISKLRNTLLLSYWLLMLGFIYFLSCLRRLPDRGANLAVLLILVVLASSMHKFREISILSLFSNVLVLCQSWPSYFVSSISKSSQTTSCKRHHSAQILIPPSNSSLYVYCSPSWCIDLTREAKLSHISSILLSLFLLS